MATDDPKPPGAPSFLGWLRQWLDIPAMVGVLLIILFGLWFVRHYAYSIS